jgi:hypothetical protein
MKEIIEAGRKACKKIYELQKKTLKEIQEKWKPQI